MPVFHAHLDAAIRAAREFAQTCGGNRLPIDVHSMARQFGIARIEPRIMTADGYLGKSDQGDLVIRFREGASKERARFTIAHEIGHIILARVQGKDVSDVSFRLNGACDAEEYAVNRIAAELLMPAPLLRRRIQSQPPSWSLLWQIRSQFSVSTSALLRRLLELPDLPTVFFRIDCSNHSSFRCQTSERPQISFGRPLDKEIGLILADAEIGDSTALRIYYADTTKVIQLVSCFMPFYGKPECWTVGWSA
jgi:Zn-dependent peptidase ImmA (M78 family)